MQAVRVERRRPVDTRWLQHFSLLSALGLLLTSIVVGSPSTTAELAERLPGHFLAPPGSPAQEWLPVRVPVRTTVRQQPTSLQVVAPVVDANGALVESTLSSAVPPRVAWVQAHRKSALYADPDAGASRQTDIPQWSFLQIVESQPNWLKVTFRGDGAGRAAG